MHRKMTMMAFECFFLLLSVLFHFEKQKMVSLPSSSSESAGFGVVGGDWFFCVVLCELLEAVGYMLRGGELT